MMLVLKMICLVSLTMAMLVNGQERYVAVDPNILLEDGWELVEHIYEPVVNSTDIERGNLRRELQSPPVCRANPVTGNVFVCGGWAGGAHDPCRNSQATCAGLTYGCSCSGISETRCSYCQLRGANAILCQQSGSRTTFVDLSGTAVTCSCEYVGNGQVSQSCVQPAPPNIPLPTGPPSLVRAPPGPSPVAIPVPLPVPRPVPVPVPVPRPVPAVVSTPNKKTNKKNNKRVL